MTTLKNNPFGILREAHTKNPELVGMYPNEMERNSWLQWHRENAAKLPQPVSYAAIDLIPDPLKK